MAFLPSPALPTASRPTHHRQTQMPTCSTIPASLPPAPSPAKKFSRRVVLAALASAAGSLLAAELSTASEEPSKLQYTVVKKGTGPSPDVGDLIGIRFKGTYNGVVFDNLFEDRKPYFFRVGTGTILKGLEEAVLLMKVGDVYDITLSGDLAFGKKGRRASPGKPTIPPDATVFYTLELSTIPGKEIELLETNPEDFE